VQCVVFQVTDRPLAEVLAQLTVDPRVESAQLNQFFQGVRVAGVDTALIQTIPTSRVELFSQLTLLGGGIRRKRLRF
jgi:hypothetical protein